jgi:hypothetical protein
MAGVFRGNIVQDAWGYAFSVEQKISGKRHVAHRNSVADVEVRCRPATYK